MRPRTITVDVTRGGDYALWMYAMAQTPEDPNDIRHVIHGLQDCARAMKAYREEARRLGLEIHDEA